MPRTVWRSSSGACGSSSSASSACCLTLRKRASTSGDVAGRLGQEHPARGQIGLLVEDFRQPATLDALADQVVLAVRARHVAQDVGDRADLVEVGTAGIVGRRIALKHDQHLALLAHRLLGGGDGTGTADGQRRDDLGKEHDIAHRHDDEDVVAEFRGGCRFCRNSSFMASSAGRHRGTRPASSGRSDRSGRAAAAHASESGPAAVRAGGCRRCAAPRAAPGCRR